MAQEAIIVDVRGAVKAMDRLSGPELRDGVNGLIRAFGSNILGVIHGKVVRKTPVARGKTAEGVVIDPLKAVNPAAQIIEWGGRVVNPLPQALALEKGRTPGEKAPPMAAIRRWVELGIQQGRIDIDGIKERKLVPGARKVRGRQARTASRITKSEAKAIDRVAWAIKTKIGEKGFRKRDGYRMFQRGLKASRSNIKRGAVKLTEDIAALIVTITGKPA